MAFDANPTFDSIKLSIRLNMMNLGGVQKSTTAVLSFLVVAIPLNAPLKASNLF